MDVGDFGVHHPLIGVGIESEQRRRAIRMCALIARQPNNCFRVRSVGGLTPLDGNETDA